MNDFPYRYSINEEITRWSFEVYIQKNLSNDQCWIAFTNPTAGPWKKIAALNTEGRLEEIYRFSREENRPDLVLVCDESKQMLIVEAKDSALKLQGSSQMEKSIAVIDAMGKILKEIQHPTWINRKDYSVWPSFLWYSTDTESALKENLSVENYYLQTSDKMDRPKELIKNPINITITQQNKKLIPLFIKNGKSTNNFLQILEN